MPGGQQPSPWPEPPDTSHDHHLVVSSPLPWPQLPCQPLCWLPPANRCDHLRQGSRHRLEPPPARCVSEAPWEPRGYLGLQLLKLCLGRELMDLDSADFGAHPSPLTTQASDHCTQARVACWIYHSLPKVLSTTVCFSILKSPFPVVNVFRIS